MTLVEQVYSLTALLPNAERFGLVPQLRRSAVSIASNIAEGHARGTRPAYIHHLRIALGSEAEVSTQIELAIRLNLATITDAALAQAAAMEVRMMVHGLIRSLSIPS